MSRNSPQIHPVRSVSESERPQSVTNSPSIKPKNSKLKKFRSRPQIRKLGSAINHKFIYSVDDDIYDQLDEESSPESEAQREKKYIEGYHDALRDLFQQKKAKLQESSGGGHNPDSQGSTAAHSSSVKDHDVDEIRNQTLEFTDEDRELAETGLDNSVLENAADDAGSVHSTSSSDTLESLNLKDRQNAINTTHPFGIKIWKPSIYKKNRSVAARADEDIHDFDPRRPTGRISLGVYVTNFIWSTTVGLFLCAVCFFGALIVFIFSGFAWHKSSRPYVKLLLQLGRYWLYPFGKFVLLNKDENYLDEDELDGRSISEFHRWRLEEEGRLFFAPPRRMTNSEARPLLKDHRGRPLRDAYATLSSDQENDTVVDEDNSPDAEDADGNDVKVRLFGRGRWSSGRILFFLFFYGILQPFSYLIAAFCWIFVFTIPMANLNSILCENVRRKPLALRFEKEKEYYKKIANVKTKKKYKNQSIVLCTYRCCGLHYYKYTMGGTNIFFINLLLIVFFVIFDYYVLKEGLGWDLWYTSSSFLFMGGLLSIIPLAYFIGQAVASISAQSSMGVGAVINAFFSTVVEIFLYCVALNQSKGKLVEGSMIGSILGGVLLLPGLSMCGGALNRKTQRYNPRSAGVSSTMLLFAMLTMFAPSLFYHMYGSYEIRCRDCDKYTPLGGEDCTTCQFIQPNLRLDELYYKVLRPLSLLVACVLFLAYICGLYFTLKTHASLIWATNSHEQQAVQSKKDVSVWKSPSVLTLDNQLTSKLNNLDNQSPGFGSRKLALMSPTSEEGTSRNVSGTSKLVALNTPKDLARDQGRDQSKDSGKDQGREGKEQASLLEDEESTGGHDAPNWSNYKSTVILLGSTVLYAIIAEILVDNVDAVLSNFPINPKFLGLTVFALVPNTTEFVNAISFAVGGNVALSMEIGSAYALQVVLIQIPSLLVYSVLKGFTDIEMIFPLVFPRWDVLATLASIYLFTYIYAEGKSNYFKGVILILIYVVVLVGFYLDDVVEDLDGAASAFTRIWSAN